jgi:hypothetical protein
MQTLASFMRMEIQVLLVALAFVVAFQLLTGKINLDGFVARQGRRCARGIQSCAASAVAYHFGRRILFRSADCSSRSSRAV